MEAYIKKTFLYIMTVILVAACGGGGGAGPANEAPDVVDIVEPPVTDPLPPVDNNSHTISAIHDKSVIDINNHKVVLNDAGEAIAYWISTARTSSILRVNHFKNGSWGTAQPLNSGFALNARVSQNSQGDALAVWTERTFDDTGGATRHEIWAANYRNDTWETPIRISSTTPAPTDYSWYAADPKVSLDVNGNAVAVWALTDTKSSEPTSLYYSQFNGSTWSAPQRLSNGTRFVNSLSIRMASNDNGNAVVVWVQNTNASDGGKPAAWPTPNVWGALYINGNFTPAQLLGKNDLPDYDSAGNATPSINKLNQGVIVWKENRAIEPINRVLSRNFDLSGFSDTIENITTSTSTTDLLDRPVVTIDELGNMIVAWRRYTLGESITDGWYRAYDAGNMTWMPAALYEDSNNDIILYLPVTAKQNGDFFFLWDDRPETTAFNSDLKLRLYNTGSGLATTIDTIGTGEEPNMATNSVGDSIVLAIKFGFESVMFTTKLDATYVPASP